MESTWRIRNFDEKKSDRDQWSIKMMSKYYAHGLPQQNNRRWWSESKISKIKILDRVVPGNDKVQGVTMGERAGLESSY